MFPGIVRLTISNTDVLGVIKRFIRVLYKSLRDDLWQLIIRHETSYSSFRISSKRFTRY